MSVDDSVKGGGDAVAEAALARVPVVLEEVAAVLEAIPSAQVASVVDVLLAARCLHWAGHGRSGLIARAVSMRCMHLGMCSHVVGETATPGLAQGDAAFFISASGRGSAVGQAGEARRSGVSVVAWTADAESPLASLADCVLTLSTGDRVRSVQHAGSLFEQAALILGDSLCGALQEHLRIATAAMDARHATLQ